MLEIERNIIYVLRNDKYRLPYSVCHTDFIHYVWISACHVCDDYFGAVYQFPYVFDYRLRSKNFIGPLNGKSLSFYGGPYMIRIDCVERFCEWTEIENVVCPFREFEFLKPRLYSEVGQIDLPSTNVSKSLREIRQQSGAR